MAIYTHLENHESFYTTLCFFIFVIILVVLIFCIIMTEIIVYDSGKIDQQTLNTIARLEKLTGLNNNKRYFKTINHRKWKLTDKMYKKDRKQLMLKQKIPSGVSVEQVINLLFEAMLIELKNTNNQLCLLPDNNSTYGVVTRAERTLQDLYLRQNTLALLIKTLSSFKPETLEQFVSPDNFPSITYQDILNRLKKLQEQDGGKQKTAWATPEEHDRGVNKKLMRKTGEAEACILESLKKIRMTEETGAKQPEDANVEHHQDSASVKIANEAQVNVNLPSDVLKPSVIESLAVKFDNVGVAEVKESSVNSFEAEQPLGATVFQSNDPNLSPWKPMEKQFFDNLSLEPNQQFNV